MIELTGPLPPAYRHLYRWRPGDRLARLDGRPVADLLDLYFYQADGGAMHLQVRRADGEILDFELPPDALEALTAALAPLEFKRCACKCVFCFIDQNPPGLRPSLYVKDEDYRFSFLYGNYVTLTSLGRTGLRRVIEQRLSPLYVSVHCTEPKQRARMLGIERTADVCACLRTLAQGGIELHTQIVLCPGWNDGRVLERSFRDLFALRRTGIGQGGVVSLAVVPVGLTAHRGHLTSLAPVTPSLAAAVIDQTAPWRAEAASVWEGPFLHLSDEFYLLSARPFPPAREYAGYPQMDNGVGLTRHLEAVWRRDLARQRRRKRLPTRPLTILTGALGAQAFDRVHGPALARSGVPAPEIIAVANDFFGRCVTVAGLLAGCDLRRALLALPPSSRRTVCLPPRLFNHDGLTLDGATLAEITAGVPHEVLIADEDDFIAWWAALGPSSHSANGA